MAHEPRLHRALRELLSLRRTGALATRDASDPAMPWVSLVPYAIDAASGDLIIHVSALAAHTRNLECHPRTALLVAAAETPGEPVHALARVSLDLLARTPEHGSADWASARRAYLDRFPEAEPMTELGDFRFVRLSPLGARQVAGFGAARSVDAEELLALLRGTD